MTDDQGYGVSGTFGGVIPTPAMDRIAKAGLRYTQFHSTALCSPTRAALITGRNHHSVGFGVIAEQSTGYPGLRLRHRRRQRHDRRRSSSRTATPRRGSARTTTRRAYQYSTAGPFDQWPVGMGFDYFYGFMGGETDQWTPYLFREHDADLPVDRQARATTSSPTWPTTPSTTCSELNAAAPDKPFFLYYVPGGTHAPHQPTQEWIDKFKGKFDMGWNALREQIFANQKRLGVIPANTKLTPWPDEPAEMGHARRRREEAVRAPGRSLRRLCRLHRPRDRPRDPGGRGHGQARQHADHLHQRRQRHQRRRHARSARRST